LALIEISADLGRTASALERIAAALELATGISRPDSALPDESAALYHDDLKQAAREYKREVYMARTGRYVAEDEELPEFEPKTDEA